MNESTADLLDAGELAERCAKAMWNDDRAVRDLGIELVEIRPGFAKMSMEVRPNMVNGHDNCHGGFIFTLADSAFAYACNYRNFVTVAQGASIEFLAPAKTGDRLTAVCEEQSRGGRTGVYDTRIRDQHGHPVALFRGKSYQTRVRLVPGLEARDGE